MRYKLLKLNAMLLLNLSLYSLQGQNILSVKTITGTQIDFPLSSIRKLTFPASENLSVMKTTGTTDNFALSAVQNLKFNETGNGFSLTSNDAKGNLHLYPNPVLEVLRVKLNVVGTNIPIVELLSIEGRVLYKAQLQVTTNVHSINVSHFQKGIYLCRVNSGTRIETTKFIKQ